MQPQAEQLVSQAAALAEAGNFGEAIPLFQRAVELDPGHGGAHDMLAQCCMEAGRHAHALAAARAACQLLPRDPGALATLGRAARNAGGALKEAAAAFEAALAEVQSSNGPEGLGAGSDLKLELQQELREVEELCLLEVGHAIGLPGLRIREAAARSELGPGGVVWESGRLLARLLVACSKGDQATLGHTCTGACGAGCGAAPAGAHGAGAPELAPAAPTAPLPGVPTFTLKAPAAAAPPSPPVAATTSEPNLQAVDSQAGPPANSPGGRGTGLPPPVPCISLLAGSRVLELGSGTGVVGIAAACLGAHVRATDLPSVLPLLRGNMELNRALVEAAGGSLVADALNWEAVGVRSALGQAASLEVGSTAAATTTAADREPRVEGVSRVAATSVAPVAPIAHPPFDWVLGADLVYSLPPVEPLVATLASLVHGEWAAGEPLPAGGDSSADSQVGSVQRGQQQGGDGRVKVLIAHKGRHQEVDLSLLEGLRRTGVAVRVVARDAASRVTIYGNAAAAAALGL